MLTCIYLALHNLFLSLILCRLIISSPGYEMYWYTVKWHTITINVHRILRSIWYVLFRNVPNGTQHTIYDVSQHHNREKEWVGERTKAKRNERKERGNKKVAAAAASPSSSLSSSTTAQHTKYLHLFSCLSFAISLVHFFFVSSCLKFP